MTARILVVEDSERIAAPLAEALRNRGFEVDVAPDGATALQLARTASLVLLDLNLPDTDGLDVCRRMREFTTVPVIIISARVDIGDKVAGLELGADDYVTKPFDLTELVARVRAHLRRSEPGTDGDDGPGASADTPPAVYDVHGIRCDTGARRVQRDGDEVELSPKEFDLLALLMRDAGRVVRREQALAEVWDPHWYGSTKTLDVHVRWLRRKIEADPADPKLITTVRGVGFRFADPDEPLS